MSARGEIKVGVIRRADKDRFIFKWADPITGRPRERISKIPAVERNRTAAIKAAKELQDALQKPAARLGPTTWDTFQVRYGTEHMTGLKDKSNKSWNTAKNHVTTILNPVQLTDLTASSLSYLCAVLRKRNTSENSIACYLRTIISALRWARAMKMIAEVPEITPPKRAKGKTKRRRARPITGEEFERMVTVAPQVRELDAPAIKRYLRGLWWSGLRLEESIELSWDWDSPFSVVFKDGRHPFFRITSEAQKGGVDQLLPVAPEFALMLQKTPKAERFGPVFDLGLAAKTVGRIVADIGVKANVRVNADGKTATAHDFRRSFGTRWATRLAPAELKALMRHASIETTMEFYVELENDELAKKLWAFAPKQEISELGDFSGDPQESDKSQEATQT